MLARVDVASSGHRAQLPAVLVSLMHFLNRARRRQSNYCLEGTSRVNNRFPFSFASIESGSRPLEWPSLLRHFQTVPHNLAQYAFYFMIKGAYLDCICTALAQRVSDFHDNFQRCSSTLYSFCANLSTRFWYFKRSQTRHVLLQSGAPPNWINIIFLEEKCVFSIITASSQVPHYYAFCNAANPR